MKPIRLITILAALLLFSILFTPTFAAAGEDLQEMTIQVVEADQCVPEKARTAALTTVASSEARLYWIDDDRIRISVNLNRVWLGAKGLAAMTDEQLLRTLKLSRVRYWQAEKLQFKRWSRGKGCI